MTITNEGVEYLIETPRYHYLEYKDGQLFPKSVMFKANILGDTYIQDLRFVDWLGMMLNNKIVMQSDKMANEEQADTLEKISPLNDPLLIVENTNSQYLTITFFNIIKKLGLQIKSLEWVE